jgi:hypothetical protein
MKATHLSQKTLGVGLLLCFSLYCGFRIVSGHAQTASEERQASARWQVKKTGPKRHGAKAEEAKSLNSSDRIIEDQLPLHIPVEVEFYRADIEPLLRNLEVKITNTSNKPIYFLDLGIVLPDVLSPLGYPIAFPLRYGRGNLIDFEEPIRADDMPIQPAGSFIFKVPEENLGSFERLVARRKISPAPVRKVYLVFHLINFGDKTGFSGSTGSRIPTTWTRQALNNSCADQERKTAKAGYRNCWPFLYLFINQSRTSATLPNATAIEVSAAP